MVGADVIRKSICISADPAIHAQFVQHYIDVGFDHLAIHSDGPDQRRFIGEYGRSVLPQLREATESKRSKRSVKKPAAA